MFLNAVDPCTLSCRPNAAMAPCTDGMDRPSAKVLVVKETPEAVGKIGGWGSY